MRRSHGSLTYAKPFRPPVSLSPSGRWARGWFVGEPNLERAIFATLAVLVMGYPCALGMATPLAMIRGGGIAACKDILMRSGEAFQVFKDVRKIVLDKTGTITRGKPRVAEVVPLDGRQDDEVLALAAATESASEHPLARAIVEAAQETKGPEAEDFAAVPGRGVRATVAGEEVLVGKPRFLEDEGVDLGGVRERLAEMEARGETVVAVAASGKPIGLIAVADTLKDDARETIESLKAAGLEPVMITGDNRRTADAVAAQVGIWEVMPEVLPDEKAEQVPRLQKEGHRVAMVGDGINDAPALMQADVGIAIESADIVLVSDRLSAVVDAYHIGRSSFRKTVQNVTLAFGFNGIGVPAAVTGFVHPVFALIAMAASVTTILANSFGGQFLPTVTERLGRKEDQVMEVSLQVPTIHCQGCASSIKDALDGLSAVQDVTVDVDAKSVVVIYRDGATIEDELRERIESIGHMVS